MKIKDLITEENWTQKDLGEEYDTDGKVCKRCLALWVAFVYHHTQFHYIADRIKEEIGCPSIVDWNDDPERTFQDVKTVVEKLDI